MGPPNYSGWFVIDTLDNTEYELGSVEDGSRKESVATQTTQAKPSQIVVLTNYSPKSYFMSWNI